MYLFLTYRCPKWRVTSSWQNASTQGFCPRTLLSSERQSKYDVKMRSDKKSVCYQLGCRASVEQCIQPIPGVVHVNGCLNISLHQKLFNHKHMSIWKLSGICTLNNNLCSVFHCKFFFYDKHSSAKSMFDSCHVQYHHSKIASMLSASRKIPSPKYINLAPHNSGIPVYSLDIIQPVDFSFPFVGSNGFCHKPWPRCHHS